MFITVKQLGMVIAYIIETWTILDKVMVLSLFRFRTGFLYVILSKTDSFLILSSHVIYMGTIIAFLYEQEWLARIFEHFLYY